MWRIIDPFVGLFVSTATLNAAMLIPMFLLLRDDIVDMRAVQSEHGERLAHIEAVVEATQTEHGERLARLEAGQGALRGDLAASNERMARIEGTVAGARSAGPSPNAWRKRRARTLTAVPAVDGGRAGLSRSRKAAPADDSRGRRTAAPPS